MDQIIIENLEIYAYHGVYPEEKKKGQRFYINATLDTDLSRAGQTDELTDSTNYGEVALLLKKKMTEKNYDLIEKAAEVCATAVLLRFPLICAVKVEVRKPEAPLPFSFKSVSVIINKCWRKAYIALGSNMGECERCLDGAVDALRTDECIRVLKVSDYIETKPYGEVQQNNFLNGVVAIETLYSPKELLDKVHVIETNNGRERLVHWGPRTLDLDILLYENWVLTTPDLVIPHRDMHNREFVLKPLCQIEPYLYHPVFRKTIWELLNEIDRKM